MAESLALYRRLVGARIRGDLQYRASFWLMTAASGFMTLMDFAVIAVLFTRVDQLEGWSLGEVAFLYGASGMSFHAADFLVGGLDSLSLHVKSGSFDRFLTRPVSPLTQLMAEGFAFRRLGRVVQAAAVLAYGLAAAPVDWTPARAAMVPAMILVGLAVYAGIWLAVASVPFWLVEGREFANAFTYGGNFLTQYPVNIYADWLRRFVVFALPLAFVGYFPSLYVLDRMSAEDRLGLPTAFVFASPLAAAAAWLAGSAVWRIGMRTYRSTGS